jgi:16S rRNA G527 N7-methylase RsmG
MSTSSIQQEIKALEKKAALVDAIRARAVSDGGRLTVYGQDFVYACIRNGMSNGDVAKILDVTTSAITQRAEQIKNTQSTN